MKDFPLHSVWHMHQRSTDDNDWLVFIVVGVKDKSRWCKVIVAADERTCPFGHHFTFAPDYSFADYCERIA